ncbi:copper resistance protein NlpE N-terminal domain-containing protein [Flavobacterium sp. CS20]|uniref:copper resistance protein NlpE N-terminal domain-containing protein n=1 Tax=Flavobacterium sp. CS20 TaxID=2775246 RepID=UPI001B3A234A|nr:copper resistance protein NlpE N-terminal domain-containing protein [Flavobacterium sp. CS20]QTY27384.1 copper resistance protein NlpE N-terminal domain-containing protein [Flavobacterium sp. CS20]
MSCNNPKSTDQAKPVDKNLPIADNSRNALDWNGTYKGILPCADCIGIETQITLNQDLSYTKSMKYLSKNDSVYLTKGQFKWNDNGSKIYLDSSKKKAYQVGENKLFVLDQKGERISGNLEERFILNKLSSKNQWLETYWKLIEIDGKPIDVTTLQNEAHLIFKIQDSLVVGSGGCNRLSGRYSLSENNFIDISQMRSTLMACENMAIEQALSQAIQNVKQYKFYEDTLQFFDDSQNKKLTFIKF